MEQSEKTEQWRHHRVYTFAEKIIRKFIMTEDNVMKIKPNDVMIRYTGRIDWTDEEKPVWVYPCTSAEMKFTGNTLKIKVSNRNNYWDNYLGCIIDQSQRSYLLNKEGITELDIVCLLYTSDAADE